MSWPHRIAPPVSTPHDETAPGGVRRDLPPDLLREVSRRFAILTLVGATLWTVGTVTGHVAGLTMGGVDPEAWRRVGPVDAISAVAVMVSLVLYWYVRGGRRDPKLIRNFGLFYMVFTSAALGMMIHINPPPPNIPIFPVISWAGAVVLMSPAIVPSTPLATLVASLIAVSMNPLAMLLARARGIWNFSSAGDAFLMHYPDYMLAGVAVVISHVVTRLGQHVAKARELGSYQLGELIGRGGMGEVYRATHRMLARPAAIKLIRPDMLGDRAVSQRLLSRFKREAETAASLRSAHTVELYDFGVTENDTLYIVMELLEGLDLESMVRQYGPMNAGRVVYLLRQVCESLEEAHARGLVHRDIKPANIHVGPHGLRHDFVKVLDFGLAKSVGAVDVNDTLPTVSMEGQIVGTPAYMAPEVALGETIDGRADLYALGCVAYYMLTGQQVFEADKILQLVTKHLEATPKPPSLRTELPVPPALDRIVLACLAKKADQRPASAADLSRLLEAVEAETWNQKHAKDWWAIHQPSVGATTPVAAGGE